MWSARWTHSRPGRNAGSTWPASTAGHSSNNASLGLYASIAESAQYRDAKLRTAAAVLPDLLGPDAVPLDLSFTGPDGTSYPTAQMILVSNNPYQLAHPGGRGTRKRLDGGVLGIVTAQITSAAEATRFAALQAAGQVRRFPGWLEWSAPRFEIRSAGPVQIGVDGETLSMDAPLMFRSQPGALRVRLPPPQWASPPRRGRYASWTAPPPQISPSSLPAGPPPPRSATTQTAQSGHSATARVTAWASADPILGGTRFVGRAIVEGALGRGNTVTMFNRGITNHGLFPGVETVIGDRTEDLYPLGRREFNAVIDVACNDPAAARVSAEALKGRVGRYVFVSTVSVYADQSTTEAQLEDAPLAESSRTPTIPLRTTGRTRRCARRPFARPTASGR